MKKILVNKDEGVAEVVERIISEEDSNLVLVIPKDSVLAESVSNFHLIGREALMVNKNVLVESVDDQVLAFAKASKLEAVHPLFKNKRGGSSLSDIVATDEKPEGGAKIKKGRRLSRDLVEEENGGLDDDKIESGPDFPIDVNKVSGEKKIRLSRSRFKFVVIAIGIIIILGGVFWSFSFFRKAEAIITFEKTPWSYKGLFLGQSNVIEINSADLVVPAEVFTEEKNVTKLFPASGRENVSIKSTGKIVVYNAYSSDPQTLVATTRFETPDGKVFRLDNRIIVPGAEIKDGKIIPASIEAVVTADKPGEEYNLTSVSRLSIPGFKGSPKFNGFYGSLTETTGGFVGERAAPTATDVDAAKEEVTRVLEASLVGSLQSGIPESFKIFDEADRVTVTNISVNRNTDEGGNFSVFGEAELEAIGIRESDVLMVLNELADGDHADKVFNEIDVSYSDISADFESGELDFSVIADGSLTQYFSVDDFLNEIAGKDTDYARSIIEKLPGLANAKVSLSPSWFSKLPSRISRIKVIVN